MSKTLLSVKIEKDLREKAQRVAREIGLPLSTVISGQLRKFIDERRIEFVTPIKMSKSLERALSRVDKDIKLGKNLSPAFRTGAAMDRYLDSI